MCFTPPVSLATAVIEFSLIFWMHKKYPRAPFLTFGSWFMFFLGLYQFSEFLLCVMPYSDIWVRLGFIAYSFLPALGLHATLAQAYKKAPVPLLYVVPITVILFMLWPGAATVNGFCNSIFITTHIFPSTPVGFYAFWLYSGLYYSGFVILSCIISVRAYLHEHDARRRKLFLFFPIAVALMTIPTAILIIILPHFDIRFPSILCHFALLLAFTVVMGVRYEHRIARGV